MGFQEKLGAFMMKFFKPKEGWENNLTEEQILDMENQGCDMTEVRAKRAAKEAQEAAEIQMRIDKLDMPKLDAYKATPRDSDSQFVKDVMAHNKIKEKKIRDLTNAPLIYGAVVQANHAIWEPNPKNTLLPVVFVFAMDEKHMHDSEFLLRKAKEISTLKNSSTIPDESKEFISVLRNDQSYFCFKMGTDLSEGADLWCATFTWSKQSTLPSYCLPPTKIVPMIMLEYPEHQQFAAFTEIPAQYYTK